jgi:RNA polymerase sigma-70 factor (ECF subfamily)
MSPKWSVLRSDRFENPVTPEQECQAGAWMRRAQQGDQRAYDDLLRLLAQEARGFVGRRVGWADWTEGVVQETLLTVHRARNTYDGARPFLPWFYAILNNRLIDALHARTRVSLREIPDEDALAGQLAPSRLQGAARERRRSAP